jgi:hypothetical protein
VRDTASNASWARIGVGAAIVVVIALWVTIPPTQRLSERFLDSLRMQQVQAVNVNLSSFSGPNANPTLQQMFTDMISKQVVTTVNEQPQTASNAADAARIAGFAPHLPKRLADAPDLTVNGHHAFTLVVDRARLQSILQEAGRSDLTLPPSIDGSNVQVDIPRTLRARYGNCPKPPSAAANVATPAPPSASQYSDCIVIVEGPTPTVSAPGTLDLPQLAEIGLELAGMTPDQTHQFLQTVDWKSTLGVSIPRSLRSYQGVTVNGAKATLFGLGGRNGPTYTLSWSNKGMDYSLSGFGNSGDALAIAESVP